MRADLENLIKSLGSMESVFEEARKMEKAEGFILFQNDNEVTNEKILSSDLVGVISSDHNGLPSVNVIKNKMNGVTGEVPLDMWFSLIEDKVALNRKAEKIHTKFKETVQEDSGVNFDEVFTDLSKAFKEQFSEAETSVGESFDIIGDNISSGFMDIFSALEVVVQDIQPRVQEVKESAQNKATAGIKKGLETAQVIKLKSRIAKLQAIKSEAISEEVATRKFIKKIDDKIDRIKTVLGD